MVKYESLVLNMNLLSFVCVFFNIACAVAVRAQSVIQLFMCS